MTLKVLTCVPVYNNDATIEGVVAGLLNETAFAILVVDDGSDRPVAFQQPLAKAALASGRLHVVRHDTNQGKGIALQTAFQWALQRGYTHLCSLDGDGQHLPVEVNRLCAATCEHPWNLIIGRRKLSGAHVPSISRFGRVFSNFWVGFQTGSHIQDSQSGFRVYPLFHVQTLTFWTSHFDFEIEVLIRLMWRGVEVNEVETEVHYPPEAERVSHFNKFTDNVRISILNTILVAMSLILKNRQPKRSGMAVGMGVFIGCTPFFGFHTLLVALFSFLFRLNAILMFVGSQVSFPPLAVLLVPLEILVGGKILAAFGRVEPVDTIHHHHSLAHLLKFAADHSLAWFVGSAILGTTLGVLAAVATWAIARSLDLRSSANWTGKTRGGRFGNGFLKLVIGKFGVGSGYTCLLAVVPYFYLFAPTARKSANQYWKIRSPELNWWQRQKSIMFQMYRFGQVLMDRAAQNAEVTKFEVISHGIEEVIAGITNRKRIILMNAHVGNWELAAALSPFGPMRLVQYQFEGLTFEKALRESSQFAMQNGEVNVMQIKQNLELGNPVGLMADRAIATHYELVPFLGRLAAFDARPFRIAASLQSESIFAFALKGKGNIYDLYGSPATFCNYRVDLPRQPQLRNWMERYVLTLQRTLDRCPEQWFNFFPFFSSPPKSPPGVAPTKEQHHLLEEWPRPSSPEPGLELGQKPSGTP